MNAYSSEEIELILSRYGDTIYRLAVIQLKSRDHADDIYQEVSLRLFRQSSRLDGEEHLKAWLIRTTLCCCKDYWKSAWHRNVTLSGLDSRSDDPAGPDTGTPDFGWITQCVQDLPEKYRIVIHLYYYEEYSQNEIAQILQIKESSVSSRLSRGRRKLKKVLKQGNVVYEL